MTTKHRFLHLVGRLLLLTALCVAPEASAQEFNPGEAVDYKTTESPSGWERGKVLREVPGGTQYIIVQKPNRFFPEGSERAYNLSDLRRPPKCSKCQAVLPSQAQFCGECGTPVQPPAPAPPSMKVCASCQNQQAEGAFCNKCGTKFGSVPPPAPAPEPPAIKTCPSCGNQQPKGAFCGKCGTKFDGATTPQTLPMPPAMPDSGAGSSKNNSPLSPEEARELNDSLAKAGSLKIEDLFQHALFYRPKDGKADEVTFFHPDETVRLLLEFKGKPKKGVVLTKFFFNDQFLSEAQVDLAEWNKEVQLHLPVTINLGQTTQLPFTLKPAKEWPVSEGFRAEVTVDGKPLGTFPFRVALPGQSPAPMPNGGTAAPGAAAKQPDYSPMMKVAEAFLILLDDQRYDDSFAGADESFRKGRTKESWAEQNQKNRIPMGKPTSRKFTKVFLEEDFRSGQMSYVFPIDSTFENGSLMEEVSVVKSSDGQFRVSKYAIAPRK